MKRWMKLLIALLAVMIYMNYCGGKEVLIGLPLMAGTETGFGIDDAETKNKWSNILMLYPQQDFFFKNNFVGKDENNIIQISEDINQLGGYLTTTLAADLTSDGTEDDLEDSEEEINFFSFTAYAAKYENAVVLDKEISLYRTAFDVRDSFKKMLGRWRDGLTESLMSDTLYASPTNYLDVSSATANLMSAANLELLKLSATTISPKIPPIMINGKEWYIVLISNYQEADLRKDDDFLAGLLSANAPGYNENPLWVKADYRWDGLMIYVYDRVPVLATANLSKAILLGRQAAVFGYTTPWDWNEAWKGRYGKGRIPAVSTRAHIAAQKCKFNSVDFATYELWTAFTELPS